MEIEAGDSANGRNLSNEELMNAVRAAVGWDELRKAMELERSEERRRMQVLGAQLWAEVEKDRQALQDERVRMQEERMQMQEEKMRMQEQLKGRSILKLPEYSEAQSKKQLLVLDLNGVLCQTHHIRKMGRFRLGPYGTHPQIVWIAKRYLYPRPGVKQFLAEVCKNFHVMIWSCMERHRAAKITDILLGDELRGKISHEHILGGEDCTRIMDSKGEALTTEGEPKAPHGPQGHQKQLEKQKKHELMFKALGELVWSGHRFFSFGRDMKPSPENTLLVDDSPLKGILNPPYSGVYIPTFGAEGDEEHYLMNTFLPWLLDMKKFNGSVLQYVRTRPFGKRAFTGAFTNPLHKRLNAEVLSFPANKRIREYLIDGEFGIPPSDKPLSDLHKY